MSTDGVSSIPILNAITWFVKLELGVMLVMGMWLLLLQARKGIDSIIRVSDLIQKRAVITILANFNRAAISKVAEAIIRGIFILLLVLVMTFGNNQEVLGRRREDRTSRYAVSGCSMRGLVSPVVESRAMSPESTPAVERLAAVEPSRDLLEDHVSDFKHLQTIPDVTKCIDAWNDELLGDLDRDYLLEGLKEGFNIIDSDYIPHSMNRSNYKSTAGVNKVKVETRILEEIEKGNYIVCDRKPSVCSALGAIPKGENDVRLIHDLSQIGRAHV